VIRVLLAEDAPIVRAGVSLLLGADPQIEIVGEVGDGQAAVEAVRRTPVDVAVIDVRMPVLDGVEATRQISRDGSETKVVVLTTYRADEGVYAALRAGALGFVLKDAVPAQLVEAVRVVAGGDAWLDPAVTRMLLRDFAARPPDSLPPPEDLRLLTPRERQVLVLVAHGLSNAEVAHHLRLGDGTVKTHVSRVLTKLGLRDRAQAVVLAYRSGLVGPGDPVPSPAL
jgi:DNA-binding NarL/FixJ family response regulator